MVNWPFGSCRALSGLAAAILSCALLVASQDAFAATVQTRAATDPNKDAELVLNARTGEVYFSRNADVERHPASLTKMMTLYLLFDALKKGQTTLDSTMPVSRHAASQKPTKLGLAVGSKLQVETAIKAIVVRSANDVAVVVAEYLGGTEANFAVQMTQKARDLGMRRTNFHNASGLPDSLQISTAEDMALLARHLIYDFPEYYSYFATPDFTYRGYTYQTHNNLIGRYQGTDGIKTGYTSASGFNLVSSVTRDGHHVIGVVFGGRSAQLRDNEMKRLLDETYAGLENTPAVAASTPPKWPGFSGSEMKTAAYAIPSARPGSPGDLLASLITSQARPDEIDEDAAEARAIKAPAQTAIPSPKPAPEPFAIAAYEQPSVAAAMPEPKPTPNLGEGDIDDTASAAAQSWSIQIGAYADRNQAQAQLDSYAQRSQDVLGQADFIITPYQTERGQTLYRARFGSFAENEARQMCVRLMQRGQTCFATLR